MHLVQGCAAEVVLVAWHATAYIQAMDNSEPWVNEMNVNRIDREGKADAVYSHAREHMWDSERAVLAQGCRALAGVCRGFGQRIFGSAANENVAADRRTDAAD